MTTYKHTKTGITAIKNGLTYYTLSTGMVMPNILIENTKDWKLIK